MKVWDIAGLQFVACERCGWPDVWREVIEGQGISRNMGLWHLCKRQDEHPERIPHGPFPDLCHCPA